MEISPEVNDLIAWLARRLNVSESVIVERSVRGFHKKIAGLDKYRKEHPHSGLGHTTEYRIWYDMMRRCFDKSRPEFVNYGARGITVAPELRTLHGFLAILGHRPKYMSLERIDNDGNYEPGNLRWADSFEQNSNKRSNDLITYEGKTRTLTEWARKLGMSQGTLWQRLYRHKWSIEEAFTRSTTHITNRKLTDAQIIEISKSCAPQSVLAERFGVAQTQISRIRTGKRWGNLTGLTPDDWKREKRNRRKHS